MRADYDTYPYFYPTPHCACGKVLVQHKTEWDLQLQKESELRVNVEGRCDGCKQNYNFVLKIYTGADGKKRFGQFDATETVATSSGVLTKNGEWDREKIIQYNKSIRKLRRDIAQESQYKIINKKPSRGVDN